MHSNSVGSAHTIRAVAPERLLEELLVAARKLGLRVRVEPFAAQTSSAGGACKILGETLVLIDEAAPVIDQAAALARVLSSHDHESVYLPPEARRYIYAHERPRS